MEKDIPGATASSQEAVEVVAAEEGAGGIECGECCAALLLLGRVLVDTITTAALTAPPLPLPVRFDHSSSIMSSSSMNAS